MHPGPRRTGGPGYVQARGQPHTSAGRSWRRSSLTTVGLVLALIGALTLSAKATSPPVPIR